MHAPVGSQTFGSLQSSTVAQVVLHFAVARSQPYVPQSCVWPVALRAVWSFTQVAAGSHAPAVQR
jgi:hypothetical protein